MPETDYPLYENTIVPALHHIQAKHGYLEPEDMKRFSRESGIPLHRLHEVASFFPHFRFTKPPKVTVKVCRDMACRMFGSARVIDELSRMQSPDFVVEGVSCQGRCDRAPATCFVMADAGHKEDDMAAAAAVGRGDPPLSLSGGALNRSMMMKSSNPAANLNKSSMNLSVSNVMKAGAPGVASSNVTMRKLNPQLSLSGMDLRSSSPSISQPGSGGGAKPEDERDHTAELYYLGRTINELTDIARACLAGTPPPHDSDAALPYERKDWSIDIYSGERAQYSAALKAAAARDTSLQKAAEILQQSKGWSHDRAEQFKRAARRRLYIDEEIDETVLEAVLSWQTNEGFAQGPDLGNWSDALLAELDKGKSDLRGLGGAGIPATQKWRDVREAIRNARRRRQDDRSFIVVNGDESEPSTFKDREILLKAPHTVVEGVILAGMATEASQGFIYIRHEYHEQIKACEQEIKRAEALGVCGMNATALGRPFPISVFPSPGGYICGEQSALIEAMSDRRGEPRNLPPMLETNGLDDRPTLVSNVETYAWTPYIWFKGGQTYADMGVYTWRGKRFFSICGDVERPGVYEVPMGLLLRDLIYGDAYCRGIKGGKKFKAFAPSGPSGGFIPQHITAENMGALMKWSGFTAGDFPPGIVTVTDPERREKHFSGRTLKDMAARRGFDFMSTSLDIMDWELELAVWRCLCPTMALGAGLCVYSEDRDMAVEAVNAVQFYRNESCGKCVPCRIGSQKLANLGTRLVAGEIQERRWFDELLPLVREMDEAIIQTSICGLGRSVPLPLRTVLNFFPEDVARHLKGRGGY